MPNVENLQEAVGMTTYEKLAIMLSAVAILIPIIQWIWKKWIVRGGIKFYPAGQSTLFFNQSGSYMRINGVIESERKPASIRKVSIVIRRQKDNKTLNLSWSQLISPVNQSIVGNYLQTSEAAHPFRVDADSIMCVFAEYTDPFDSFLKTFRSRTANLFANAAKQPIFKSNYDDALIAFTNEKDYSAAKDLMKNEFYWEVGRYDLDVVVEYNNRKKVFPFEFTVTEQSYSDLLHNIDESLVSVLKNQYQVRLDFHSAFVELTERKA